MSYFHYRCGERITLINDNYTAIRNESEFDHGLVITAEPLVNDTLFEIKIDKKVNSWSGSLEIGVVDCDPLNFNFPPCASKIQTVSSWIMSGTSVFRNGVCLVEGYAIDLDKLNQDDRIGLMRTSEGDLVFYINGESLGVGAEELPSTVYAIVDLYGKCVQVSITNPANRENNNDECWSGSSVLAIENDNLNVTLGGDLSELSMSSSTSLDIRMDMNVSLSLAEETTRHDRLRFHDRCGSLVKLSNGNRSAERRRPMDEFNNGVVMTHRPLRDGELFEIRIDRLVDKWSGSIEMGITTHNPSTLVFPATMTNLRSGTIMMSGCSILTNGKGTRREYGDFNLDELAQGDRVGMMRKASGDFHYFINGLDQGIAAQRVPATVWGVIDLYGMTIKVSIVERDEREEQNLMTRRNTRDQQNTVPEPQSLPDYYDRLTFHTNCGTHAQVINNGRTAHRPNSVDDFNNGVVLTARTLKANELFEVRLDRVVTKWAGSIEIGVTTHSPDSLEFPFTMTNVRSGTWMMTGSGIMNNGTIILEQYGVNLDRLQVGDRVGVLREENGMLHFFVNGIDQGSAAASVPDNVYGVIDLYGQAVEATIMDMYDYNSPDTMHSSFSNATLYSDLKFHHVHGKNARIVSNGLTALRPKPLAEFNDAIVFSSRPLRDGELFEVTLDSIVDRWSGSIELGITAVRPDDIELPSTATDLCRDTWMLSGSSVMVNGQTVKNNYALDLDALESGVRLGVSRSANQSLEFYKNGVPQGVVCAVPFETVYAVVDLYGQCAQVSIPCESPVAGMAASAGETSHHSTTFQSTAIFHPPVEHDLHRFSEFHSRGILLEDRGRLATRSRDCTNGIVFSALPLVQDEVFEISIMNLLGYTTGTLQVGITDVPPAICDISNNRMPNECYYLSGNEFRYNNEPIGLFTPSLEWLDIEDRLGILRTHDNRIKVFLNEEEMPVNFPTMPEVVFAVYNLRGACSKIAVTSHQGNWSPRDSMRLETEFRDSLELLVFDQDHSPDDLMECRETESGAPFEPEDRIDVAYSFHENHGNNIELSEGRSTARRVASYNQGVTIVQPALLVNSLVRVVIEQVETHWSSSLIVGLAVGPPPRLNLPVSALAMKAPCCIVTNDWISVNGIKTSSDYGAKLEMLKAGDIIGLMLTNTGYLKLSINGQEEKPLHWGNQTPQSVYAVFDLYGQCKQLRIINSESDLVIQENVTSPNHLALPIPSTSTWVGPATILRNSPRRTPIKTCSYKEECEKLKKWLLIPDQYFADERPRCYCENCYKLTSESDENSYAGWVKFPLVNSKKEETGVKWQPAFYFSKLGAVRSILDTGQPLTKGRAEYCGFTDQIPDDTDIAFYPTLQKPIWNGFKINVEREAFAAFRIFIKQGSYSVTKTNGAVEWSTKDAGALKLDCLLFKIGSIQGGSDCMDDDSENSVSENSDSY